MIIELDTRFDNLIGSSVRVAFNRHKRLWSIRIGSKVVAYTDRLLLSNVQFEISEAGRQRVISTGKRNVHAFAHGKLLNIGTAPLWSGMIPISYNPFKNPYFIDKETGEPIHYAAWVTAGVDGMFAYKEEPYG